MELVISLEIVAFIAICLGIIGRTCFPYLNKADKYSYRDDFGFDLKYAATALFTGIISAIFVYPLFIMPDGTTLQVFIAAFIFAWGSNDVINRVVK